MNKNIKIVFRVIFLLVALLLVGLLILPLWIEIDSELFLKLAISLFGAAVVIGLIAALIPKNK